MASKRVLVVDDDETLRETLGEVLTDDGFDVRVAWNGRDALEKLDGWAADVVILDVMMPVMDAYAFREAMDGKRASIPPLILLSAAPGLSTAATKLGAAAVISKPFQLTYLIEEVRRVAAGRRDPPEHGGGAGSATMWWT